MQTKGVIEMGNLKFEMGYDAFIQKAKEYGQSLQALPPKLELEWKDEIGGDFQEPPITPTLGDFELAIAWVVVSEDTERERKHAKGITLWECDAPGSLGVPNLTYLDPSLINRIDERDIEAIWQDHLENGKFYRPDVLVLIAANWLDKRLDELFEDLAYEMGESRLDKIERDLLKDMAEEKPVVLDKEREKVAA